MSLSLKGCRKEDEEGDMEIVNHVKHLETIPSENSLLLDSGTLPQKKILQKKIAEIETLPTECSLKTSPSTFTHFLKKRTPTLILLLILSLLLANAASISNILYLSRFNAWLSSALRVTSAATAASGGLYFKGAVLYRLLLDQILPEIDVLDSNLQVLYKRASTFLESTKNIEDELLKEMLLGHSVCEVSGLVLGVFAQNQCMQLSESKGDFTIFNGLQKIMFDSDILYKELNGADLKSVEDYFNSEGLERYDSLLFFQTIGMEYIINHHLDHILESIKVMKSTSNFFFIAFFLTTLLWSLLFKYIWINRLRKTWKDLTSIFCLLNGVLLNNAYIKSYFGQYSALKDYES